MLCKLSRVIAPCCRNTAGNVVVAFAIAVVPIVGLAGAAVDYSRATELKASLQAAVDAAALAGTAKIYGTVANAAGGSGASSTGQGGGRSGNNRDCSRNCSDDKGNTGAGSDAPSGSAIAAATAFMNARIAALPAGAGATFTAAQPDPYTVTVTASARLDTTSLAFLTSLNVAVTATATVGAPIRYVNVALGKMNSDACDSNQIYFYVVPADGSVPPDSALTLVLSNDPNKPAPTLPPTSVPDGAQIGFALFNTTGGVCSYGDTQYGWKPGSVHKSYSHRKPACTGLTGTGIPAGCMINNLQETGATDCKSGTVKHAWNDMGGNPDDMDYNDMTYSFSCSQTATDITTVRLSR
jgi:hypothetical protein